MTEPDDDGAEYARLREPPKVDWNHVHFHSLYEPLGAVIADALEQYRDSGLHGYPGDLPRADLPKGHAAADAGNPSWMRLIINDEERTSDPGFAQWLHILTMMADGFRASAKLDDYGLPTEEREAAQETYDRGMDLFTTYFLHLWD